VAPAAPAATVMNSPEDLKPTKAIDTSRPTALALDLPLVDVPAPAAPPLPEIASSGAPPPSAATNGAASPTVAGDGAGAPPNNDNTSSAAEAAESFVSYETQRIQGVLKASS